MSAKGVVIDFDSDGRRLLFALPAKRHPQQMTSVTELALAARTRYHVTTTPSSYSKWVITIVTRTSTGRLDATAHAAYEETYCCTSTAASPAGRSGVLVF